jgi:hypothetical protein
MAGTWGLREDAIEAALLVATANAPNGCRMAAHLPGHVLDALTPSNAQEDVRVLNLEPGV